MELLEQLIDCENVREVKIVPYLGGYGVLVKTTHQCKLVTDGGIRNAVALAVMVARDELRG